MDDEDDPFSARPHAFKLIFEDEGTIDFFADNAADKTRWVAALRSVVGKSKRSTSIPPLWAQTLHAANKERQRVSEANRK
jgi:hypothetical protein